MDDQNFNQEREAIQLPKALKGLPIAQDLPSSKQAWNSNEEIASLLIAFEKHKDWKQREIRLRPPSGSMLLYNRKKVSYRRDGYCWKKRKDGKTIREDHMKLKVQGVECIYGSYVHSAVLPTFHRRSYWLLQNPDLVLVHYLNVPYADNSKLTIPTLSYYLEKKQWSKEELVDQLRPMLFTGVRANHEETESVEETIAVIVKQLLDHQDKHFKSKLHKCDALCDKNCTLRCISPKREDKFVGSNINSRLASLLERNSQGSNIARSAHVIGDSGNILLASSSAQPIATLTAINNDQGSTQSAAPIILNLSNLQGRNGIIILSGQTHTPISIINTSQTQQPPITTESCNIEPGSCMVPQEASVPKHNHINLGKDDVCVNVPMQISSVTEDLSMHNSTVNTTKPACVNMFPQADFSLPQSVLQQLSVSQADLPTSTPPNQSSAIPSTSCDEFKNDLPFPPPSELSLDNLDLLDFADMDKLCSGWSDISVDVASNSIPQSSFNLATDDKSISLLNCTNSLGSQDISHQQSSNLSHLGNHPHGSNPFQQLQTVLSDAQLISSINLTAQTPLYTNSTNASVTHSSASQFCHAHPHLINQEHQQQAVPVQPTSQQQQHSSIQQQQHNLQQQHSLQQRHTTQHNSLQQQQHGVQRHQLPHPHSLQSQDAQPSHLHSHHALQQQQQRQPVPQNPPMQQQQHPSVLLASPLRNLPSLHSDMKKDPTATLDNVKSDSLSDISDFSPDWSYTEGGTKVLITGPWVTTSNKYAIMFDNKSISATLVQPGVLRCFAPEHTEGLVTLEVSLNDHVISNSVVFEYKRRERREATPGHGDWFSVDENQLQLMLLDRLAQLEKKLASNCITKVTDEHDQSSEKPSDREGQLIAYCQLLSQRPWLSNDPLPKLHSHGCCLLHLASALGYEKLIQHLIHWRSQSSSVVLEKEVDAESLDNYSATPLMWACAKGHVNTALCLYACSNTPMKLCNKDGLSPLDVARRNGHHTLAEHLEMLEQDTAMLTDQTQLDLGSPIPDLNQFLLDPKGDHPLTKPTVIPSISSETLSTYCPAVLSPGGGANPAPPLSSLHIDIPSPPKYSTTNTKLGRRFSEQTSASILRRRFNKGFSMETFPGSSITNYCSTEGMDAHQALRIANSEPDLGANIEGLSSGDNPMISDHCHSPDLLLQTESLLGIHRLSEQDDNVFASMSRAFQPVPQQHSSPSNQVVAMDTDEISSIRSVSPFIDVEKVSSDDEELLSLTQQAAALSESSSAEGQHQMVTLANQIIAAMPERIKSSPSRCDEGVVTECHRGRSESHSSIASQNSPPQSLYGDDSGISTPLGEGHSFEEFRYREIDTPASSLSPDSTCLPSPYSPYSFLLDSPPPTTADFNEYFNAPTTYLEKDFSQLTLSDHEQRKLYEAAKLIQNAFRIYRDKQQQQQQLQKEIEAAILIQSYYRRYKQYIYFKKMTQAAVLIQSQFRSYSAQKRYKKSRDAAVVIQNQYRTYKQHERFKKSRNAAVIIQQRFRNHYQRKQNQEMASTLLQMASDSNDKLPGFPYIIEQCYSSTVTELSCARCKHFNQRRPNMCRH